MKWCVMVGTHFWTEVWCRVCIVCVCVCVSVLLEAKMPHQFGSEVTVSLPGCPVADSTLLVMPPCLHTLTPDVQCEQLLICYLPSTNTRARVRAYTRTEFGCVSQKKAAGSSNRWW